MLSTQSFTCLTSCVNVAGFCLQPSSFLLLQLIGGLADEKIRWAESVKGFDSMLVNVIGDVMMSAGVVAYLGAFTVSPQSHIHQELLRMYYSL